MFTKKEIFINLMLLFFEFVTILSFTQKFASENEILKWKHDSETNILDVEMSKNCVPSRMYSLHMTITYKNYANIESDKVTPNKQMLV
jgi:hypothetical protein